MKVTKPQNFGLLLLPVKLLPSGDRRKFITFIFVKIAFGFLELIAIALVGLTVSLLLAGFGDTPDYISRIFKIFAIDAGAPLEQRIIALFWMALLIVFIVGIKGVLSTLSTKKLARFLARIEVQAARSLFEQKISSRQSKLGLDRNKLPRALTVSVHAALYSWPNILANLIAEVFVVVLVFATLFFVQPAMTLLSAVYFLSIAFFVNRYAGMKTQNLATLHSESQVRTYDLVQDISAVHRELKLSGRENEMYLRFVKERELSASFAVTLSVLQSVPRYIFEVALLFGALLMATVAFSTGSISQASANVVLFFAAGSRLAPSFLGLTTQLAALRNAQGDASTYADILSATRPEQGGNNVN